MFAPSICPIRTHSFHGISPCLVLRVPRLFRDSNTLVWERISQLPLANYAWIVNSVCCSSRHAAQLVCLASRKSSRRQCDAIYRKQFLFAIYLPVKSPHKSHNFQIFPFFCGHTNSSCLSLSSHCAMTVCISTTMSHLILMLFYASQFTRGSNAPA